MSLASRSTETGHPPRGLFVDDLSVSYANAQTAAAVSALSLNLDRGSFLAVIGRSGSGKSTLLRVIAGLIKPSRGDAWFAGERITGPPQTARLVDQNYSQSLLPWLTVRQNVAFGVRHSVTGSSSPSALVSQMLEFVGLADVGARYPSQLSGGMQQRVAIARALASQPSLLLLDEAFGAVDALSRAKLQDMVLDLWERLRFTCVLVTHDVDEAIYLADRVAVMDERGRGLVDLLDIELPRPRDQVTTRETPRYLKYRRDLMRQLLASDRQESRAS